ncbi:hypothetical protein CDV31_004938 [Fusarium ambrosium]|uniref:Uncharacterized protein n=1 Tax=Fusarium ambrosium TaxID=131363 RepID=A0A428UMR4_9HYPO|nr:hypothetical protein CDV31_004938 [Fusarium ambrosium]
MSLPQVLWDLLDKVSGMRFHIPPGADEITLVSTPDFHLRDPIADFMHGHVHTLDLHLRSLPNQSMEETISANSSIYRRTGPGTCYLCSR